eukprot:2753751-Pyramimonas_sp.AAC.1
MALRRPSPPTVPGAGEPAAQPAAGAPAAEQPEEPPPKMKPGRKVDTSQYLSYSASSHRSREPDQLPPPPYMQKKRTSPDDPDPGSIESQ